MAVPTQPTAGEPIAEAWGDLVHAAVVAQDVQSGSVSCTVTSSTQGSVVVNFPRPFAGNPVVVAMIGPSSSGAALAFFVQAAALSATAVTLRCSGAAASSFTVPVMWVAYGPRA